jgi:PAS domain S-box-containing protein
MSRSKRWELRYGFAVLAASVVSALAMFPIINRGLAGVILFAVMLTAWYGGRGPGLLATALFLIIAVATYAVSRTPIPPNQIASFAIFVALGVAITFVVDSWDAARRRAEQSEKWLSAVLMSIGDAVIATDQKGELVFMNPRAEALTAWDEAEARGKNLVEVFPLIDETTRQPAENPVTKVLKAGRIRGLANHTVLIARDGSEMPIDDSAAPILDEQNQIQGVVLVFRDVTERRKADELRERLAAIVDSSDDAIVSNDLNGVVTSWNKAAERIFGYRADEVVGKNISMLMPEDLIEDMSRILDHVRRGERIQHFATKRKRKDGACIDVSVSVSSVRDGYGAIVGASRIARDITEQKRIEAERRDAERRKDEFLAMLGHELRNPIAALANAVAVSNEAQDPQNIAWARQVVDRQLNLLSRLIDDLLDVSRITRGKIRLLRESIDARTIVNHAVESARALIEERKHALETVVPSQPLMLDADAARLEQVFVNLLANAAKYTEVGGRIRFTAESSAGEVVFRVQDTGIGIAPEEMPRVFELFSQGQRTPGRSEGGLGVGLTIVKSLVEMHGGAVSVQSDGRGSGSTFVVRLPASASAPLREVAPAPPPPTSTPVARVLIIDDNRDLADGLARILRFHGHQVATVHDGPEGIEAARTIRPGVILLDIGLPTLDGYQVARILRAEGCLSDAVIIAISGYGQEEDVRRSREAGMNHHLVKPIDLNALSSLLSSSP